MTAYMLEAGSLRVHFRTALSVCYLAELLKAAGKMWERPESVQILLFTAPTDRRKGFEILTGLVRAAGEDVYGGAL